MMIVMVNASDGAGTRRIRILIIIALVVLVGIFLLRACFAEWLEKSLYG